MIKIISKLLLASVLFALVSCRTADVDSSIEEYPKEYGKLNVFFSFEDTIGTKSLVKTNSIVEQKIGDAVVAVFDNNGKCVAVKYSDNASFGDMCLLKTGNTYYLYAVANMGNVSSDMVPDISTTYKSTLDNWRYTLESYNKLVRNGCLPMSGKATMTVQTSGTAECCIVMRNLASKVTLTLSKNLDPSFSATLSSVKLKNAPRIVYPFHEESSVASSAEVFNDSDYADADEVAIINNGNTVSFYALENMQGASGTSSAKERIGNDRSTYLELQAHIAGGAKESDPIFRWWVGKDTGTDRDYNMKGGIEYQVGVTLRGEGFTLDDNRVLSKEWKYLVTEVIVNPAIHAMNVGETKTFSAAVLPETLEESAKNVLWTVSDPTVLDIISSDGTSCTVKALKSGTAEILATSITSPSISGTKSITVNDTWTFGPVVKINSYADDIPASGSSGNGVRAIFNLSQNKYKNGNLNETLTWTEYGSYITAESLMSTEKERSVVGQSTVSGDKNGQDYSFSHDIYQQANTYQWYLYEHKTYELSCTTSSFFWQSDGRYETFDRSPLNGVGTKYVQQIRYKLFTSGKYGDNEYQEKVNVGNFCPEYDTDTDWIIFFKDDSDYYSVSINPQSSVRTGNIIVSAPSSVIAEGYIGSSITLTVIQYGNLDKHIDNFGTWRVIGRVPGFDKGYWNVQVEYTWNTGYSSLDNYLKEKYGTFSQQQQSWDETNQFNVYDVLADILGNQILVGSWNNGIWFWNNGGTGPLPKPDGEGSVQIDGYNFTW